MRQKLLMVGAFSYYFYETALAEALEKQYSVLQYRVFDFTVLRKLLTLRSVNKRFHRFVLKNKPEIIFFYRTNMITVSTLHKIKESLPEIKILLYHNDNPYIGSSNKIKYFFFLRLVPYVDIVYCYRKANLLHARKLGAKRVEMLMPHFCSKIHFKDDAAKKDVDVVFVGHYEADGRVAFINELVKGGVNIKVYGKWNAVANKLCWPSQVVREAVFNDDYRIAIAKARIALCFLSKRNNDGYTRRCFEIPAIGTLLLSEYSEELKELFEEGKEAVFFRSPEELAEKVKNLLSDSTSCKEISDNANRKVKEGYSEFSRSATIINDIQSLHERS